MPGTVAGGCMEAGAVTSEGPANTGKITIGDNNEGMADNVHQNTTNFDVNVNVNKYNVDQQTLPEK